MNQWVKRMKQGHQSAENLTSIGLISSLLKYLVLSLSLIFLNFGCHSSKPHPSSSTSRRSPAPLSSISSIFSKWSSPQIGHCLGLYLSFFKLPSFSSTLSPSLTQPLLECVNIKRFHLHSSLQKHQVLFLHQTLSPPYLKQSPILTDSILFWKSSQDPRPLSLSTLISHLQNDVPAFPKTSTSIEIQTLKVRRTSPLIPIQNSLALIHSFSLSTPPSNLPELSSSSTLIYFRISRTLPSLHHSAWWSHLTHPFLNLSFNSTPFFYHLSLSPLPPWIQSSSPALLASIVSSHSSQSKPSKMKSTHSLLFPLTYHSISSSSMSTQTVRFKDV